MKRFHVHIAVPDLDSAINFYATMFGLPPTVVKSDYAKWMLDDPHVNFAISTRGHATGVNHLGFQVDSNDELAAMHGQLRAADEKLVTQTGTACCYARSDKYWVEDPAGIAWETFHSLEQVPCFGDNNVPQATGSACCIPAESAPAKASACCPGS